MDIDDKYKWSQRSTKFKVKYLNGVKDLYGDAIKANPETKDKTLESISTHPKG
jgi:hypothetical protein